jgi:DNA-binding NtrC family response regulator
VKTAANGEEGYPVKNGLEMVRGMRNHDPGIKTIYMNGDMSRFRTRLEEEKTKYKASFLDKPFSCSKLTELFHEYQKERR